MGRNCRLDDLPPALVRRREGANGGSDAAGSTVCALSMCAEKVAAACRAQSELAHPLAWGDRHGGSKGATKGAA
ncbi:hypothetical protein GCM10025869_13130 [Homoserinibacter gongjuensis]|uniref:Uncharacterized protein n=1 Tax=Homoserinibacter gongjuensis TaxID=1162968 RepID=A0ABQ6JUL0_9MICO|nr:hypothetical protein GCM10025869_13130 [Homoserinibacter gongjuensis]